SPHRLRAVEGDFPATQIKTGELFVGYLSKTQVVGEVWSARVRHSIVRDCLEPSIRASKKSRGRHQVATKASIDRLDQSIDKANVMKVRQPRQPDAVFRMFEAVVDVF